MTLAIFDLDNTLLAGDSDHSWGEFLAELGVVDPVEQRRKHDYYFEEYQAGRLDINEFLRFQLAPLTHHPRAELERWRKQFLQQKILPMITPDARRLVESHRARGHRLIIITATNSFITRPIADEFGIDVLIASEPKQVDGQFTGEVDGTPSYREGKVIKLSAWLETNGETLVDSWFYSDSHNDLPLLRAVAHPVAVNPDAVLAVEAKRQDWPIMEIPAERE